MTVYINITFIISSEEEIRLLRWIKLNIVPSLSNFESSGGRLSLRKVIEAGGEPVASDNGLNLALQAEFTDKEGADLWAKEHLPALLGKFYDSFGPEAAYFVTQLEEIPLP